MKIAISAQGEKPDSFVDERFGRAQGFIFFDDNTNTFTYEDNTQNLSAMQGAGIQSAKRIIDSGAAVLITGNVGPKAYAALNSASVEIYCGAKGTVLDAISKFKEGVLTKTSGASVEGHW